MNVLEAMHADVKSASPEASVQEIARLMAENDIGAIPISKDGHLVGIVTDRDIVIRAVVKSLDLGKTTAGDIMTEHVVFCKTNERVGDAIHLMEQKKIRRLPVLDDKSKLVGMLSLGDVAHAAPRAMSGELLQEVADHHE